MAQITIGHNPAWTIPQLEFCGTPTGIDICKVVERNMLPAINTGIAHREPGVGQVGAGLTQPPWECFFDAFEAFSKSVLTPQSN